MGGARVRVTPRKIRPMDVLMDDSRHAFVLAHRRLQRLLKKMDAAEKASRGSKIVFDKRRKHGRNAER